jgi:uncharacterized protein YajQ (UPF0234 family)
MERIDSTEEWRSLKENYAHKTDGELQAVADEGYELTETARQVLKSEISGRGLDIQVLDAPARKRRIAPRTGRDPIQPQDSPVRDVHPASSLAKVLPMEGIDVAEEWRSLKENYAHKTDGELQAVADEGWELTETARQVLKSEIFGRGLDIQVLDSPAQRISPVADFDPGRLEDFPVANVHLASGLDEAGRIQWALNEENIPSCLGPDNLESVDEFPPGFEGEVMVKVCNYDWRRASKILDELLPERRQNDPDPDSFSPIRCPNCQSEDIVFRSSDPDRDPEAPIDSTYLWYCEACGGHWKDEPQE